MMCRCKITKEYTNKSETSSTNISLKAMKISCGIDAKEGRYMAVTDMPGEFLHVEWSKTFSC